MRRESSRRTYTVEEVGSILGIGRSSAYEAVRTGKIPSIRIGRRVVIPRAAIDQMLQAAAERVGQADA